MLKPLRILILALLLPVIAFTQKESPGFSIDETGDYQIEEFILPGGQRSNNVNCIAQGPNGFMWFGSHDGLHRYDGHEIITFGKVEGDTLSETTSLTFPYIENLFWDRFDKLWVCSYGGGVYRFDPNTEQFKHYQFDLISPDLSQYDLINFVMCAAEDARGNLWFGTKQGLIRMDRETDKFEHFLPDSSDLNSLSNQHVSNIYLDLKGTLWIATGFLFLNPEIGGLNRYDSTTNSFITYSYNKRDSTSLGADLVKGLLEDHNGNFWVGSSAGLQKMDRSSGIFEQIGFQSNNSLFKRKRDQSIPKTFSLLEDRKGGLWIGTTAAYDYSSYLFRYDPISSTFITFPVSNSVWHLCESTDGTIWVSGGGIGGKVIKIMTKEKEREYDIDKGESIFEGFKKTAIYQKLHGNFTDDRFIGPLSITFDPMDKTMWGRYIYDVRKHQDYSHYPILVNYDQRKNESHFYYPETINLDHLTSAPYLGNNGPEWSASGIAIDKEGKIWSTYASDSVGLFSFDPRTNQTIHYLHNAQDSSSLLSNLIVRMIMDSQGYLWTAHYSKGLSRLNPSTGKCLHFLPETNRPHKIGGIFPLAILEDPKGRIWVGGKNEQEQPFLTVINEGLNNSQDILLTNEVLEPVRFIACNEEKLVFAIGQLGLEIRDLSKPEDPLIKYNISENNFPIEYVTSCFFDKEGNLWGSSTSSNQFFRLDPEKKNWLTFRAKTKDASRVRTGNIGPDGHFYFPGEKNGWREIDPTIFKMVPSDSTNLKLTNLYVKGKRLIPGKSDLLTKPIFELDRLYLPNGAMPFMLRFSSFDFHSPKVKYKYRLFPYDSAWKPLIGQPVVSYPYLPTGTYQFQVQAYNVNGLVNEKGTELEIIILPPWWNTWWAYILYCVVFLLLIFGINQFQRRRWQMQTQLQLEQERGDRLKELDYFKSRFYTNITHEFRTPLTVIKGMSEQLVGNKRKKKLIQQNSERVLNMVNQLLDLSKLENNSLTIHWINGNITPFLQYLTESCHSLAQNKKLNLSFFSKEDHLIMDFDENKIQQILINLISNAIKFTPEFGSVKVVASKIVEKNIPYLKILVSDTGKGIPPDKLVHVFDRFYQVDDSSTRHSEGSGIGLALVKEMTELLGGNIQVDSKLSKGSSFSVFLPIQNKAQKGKPEFFFRPESVFTTDMEETLPVEPDITNDEKPMVLIIEDNADIREYIISCLNKKFNLMAISNGREGVEKALEHIPDVILCDVMMPEMNGFEVCQKLKTDIHTSHIPIILLTAKATQEDKVTGLASGADAYLTKPFDKKELLVRLANLAAQSKKFRERLETGKTSRTLLNESENREAEFLLTLDEIITTNLHDELFDTYHLCRAVAMSRAQLHRKLKALTGHSTAKYIRTARLQKAKTLLETTDIPIGEIALQVGFKDFSHFSRTYTRVFGLKPSETRN